MNFAFGAAALLLLFAPGVIFRRAYFSYPLFKTFATSSASDEVAYSALPAIFLQVLAVEATTHFTSYRIDFDTLGALLVGSHSDSAQRTAFHQLGNYVGPIAMYNLVLWSASAFLGYWTSRLVFGLDLDCRYEWLRFNNDWFYLMTGRQWRFKEGRDFDVIWIDALTRTGPGTVLYSGILDYYFLARDGGLDAISLRNAMRWVEPHPRRPVPVPGHSLALKYSELVNINIAFYKFDELPQPRSPEDAA